MNYFDMMTRTIVSESQQVYAAAFMDDMVKCLKRHDAKYVHDFYKDTPVFVCNNIEIPLDFLKNFDDKPATFDDSGLYWSVDA